MKDDLTYLAQLAKGATKGNWIAVGCVVENDNDKGYPDICGANFTTDYMSDDDEENCANISYIAAAQPKVILLLIAEIRRLRRLVSNLSADVAQ